VPSLSNTNSGPSATLTWDDAARRAARVIGGANDPETLDVAKEALSEILQEWNAEKEWRFTQIIAPAITVTADTARYALPTTFKKPYDAYLGNDHRKLEYLEGRRFDAMGGEASFRKAVGYMLYNVGTTGEIELFGTPVAGDVPETLIVRYYRLIDTVGNGEDLLDIPAAYVPALLAGTRALLCAERADTALNYWEAKYRIRLAAAKVDDARIPDEVLGFVSEAQYRTGGGYAWLY
jgi:hypothetical protein